MNRYVFFALCLAVCIGSLIALIVCGATIAPRNIYAKNLAEGTCYIPEHPIDWDNTPLVECKGTRGLVAYMDCIDITADFYNDHDSFTGSARWNYDSLKKGCFFDSKLCKYQRGKDAYVWVDGRPINRPSVWELWTTYDEVLSKNDRRVPCWGNVKDGEILLTDELSYKKGVVSVVVPAVLLIVSGVLLCGTFIAG